MRSMASTSQRCSRRVAGSRFSSWAFSEPFMAKDGKTARPKERKPARADAGNTRDMHFIGLSGTPRANIVGHNNKHDLLPCLDYHRKVTGDQQQSRPARNRIALLLEMLQCGLWCAAQPRRFHIGAVATVLLGGIEDLVGLVDRLPQVALLLKADAADAACDAGFLRQALETMGFDVPAHALHEFQDVIGLHIMKTDDEFLAARAGNQ